MNCIAPIANPYQRLGGASGVDAFVTRLYDIMAADPEAGGVWKLHSGDMDEVKARFRAFLSGWLGGPAVYTERYGPPMLRRRHMAFPIGPKERAAWLKCARSALAETVPDEALRADLDYALTDMAEHMRNRDEEGRIFGTGCCRGQCHG